MSVHLRLLRMLSSVILIGRNWSPPFSSWKEWNGPVREVIGKILYVCFIGVIETRRPQSNVGYYKIKGTNCKYNHCAWESMIEAFSQDWFDSKQEQTACPPEPPYKKRTCGPFYLTNCTRSVEEIGAMMFFNSLLFNELLPMAFLHWHRTSVVPSHTSMGKQILNQQEFRNIRTTIRVWQFDSMYSSSQDNGHRLWIVWDMEWNKNK